MSIAAKFGFSVDPYTPAIALGLVRTFFGIIATVALRKAKRRTLLTITALIMTAAAFGIGLLLMLAEEKVAKFGSVALLVIFTGAFGGGVGVIPWLLCGELCPIKVKI